jgi:tetratricopeptide (TPR) repeat protein
MKPIFRLAQPARLLAALLVSASLHSGLAQAQQDGAGDEAAKPIYPSQELTPQILHQMMLAEVAAARGQTVMAARSYLDLARRTRDGRIARRAAEMALFARDAEMSGEASRLWLELEPGSVQAQQLASGTLASGGPGLTSCAPTWPTALARQGDAIGPALMGLNRGLARIPDKALIRRLVSELTEPYLAHPEAWFARANAAFVGGDNTAASDALDGALRLRPDWEQAVVLKAQFQEETAPGSGIRALQMYVDEHPEAREPRITLARLLVAAKQFAPARAQFEQILQRAPDDKDAIHAAGLLSMQLGDRVTAEAHFRHLLDLGFAEPDSIRTLSGADRRGGEALR